MINTDEMLHVYDAHTANAIKFIQGSEDDYSHSEMSAAIREANEEMLDFRNKWLISLLDELNLLKLKEDE